MLSFKNRLPVHCQDIAIVCSDFVNLRPKSCGLNDFGSVCRFWNMDECLELLAEELGDARENANGVFC